MLYRMTVKIESNRSIEINTTAALALIVNTDSVSINHKEQRVDMSLGSITITYNKNNISFSRPSSVRCRIGN